MKKRFTTELSWNPCLASNDNMLAYVTSEIESHIWLHKVRITRLSGEKTAKLEIDFYNVSSYIAEPDFFKDYRAISGMLIFDRTPELRKRLRLLESELRSEISAGESFGNTIHFNFPLLGKNFIRRGMEAVAKVADTITNGRDAWISNLQVIQSKTEVFDASKGWITLEEHILSKHR